MSTIQYNERKLLLSRILIHNDSLFCSFVVSPSKLLGRSGKVQQITILALIDRSQYSLSYEAKYKSKFNMAVFE
jgi:hypothetical protein